MDAHVCDRCGETFPSNYGVVVKAYRNDLLRTVRCINRLSHVDLCPKCILALDSFIDNYEPNEMEEKV